MRVKQWLFVVGAALFALSLAGCGGGGGGAAPAAGTPVVSKGMITQLGSVYVNGIKFNVNNAAINMEDPTDVSGGLKVGMIVTVKGTLDDASNGTASSVDFSDNLKGPIATFSNISSSMTVLGQKVRFDPARTVFDNFSGAGTMGVKPGQMVQVSGMADASGTIIATRIERHLPDWTPSSVIELKGSIGTISGTTFTINGLQVDASGVTLPTGMTIGTFVRVEGTLPALSGAPLKATEVKLFTEGVQAEEGKHAEVEGLVSGLTGTTFMIGGTAVDASGASSFPAGVANGVMVEVEGTFVNNVLKATTVRVEWTPPVVTPPPPVVTPPPVPTPIPVDTPVPNAPSTVTATGGTNSVSVSWTAVAGATSYNLYWSTTTGVTTATGTKITGVTSPSRQTFLAANTTYFYIVTAMNGAGESAASSQASATTSATDGVALYGTNCAGCHNPLATSSKKNRTAAQIQAAINGNVGGMGFLSTLTAAQVQAIADVLTF